MKSYALSKLTLAVLFIACVSLSCKRDEDAIKKNSLELKKQTDQLQSTSVGASGKGNTGVPIANKYIIISSSETSMPAGFEAELSSLGAKSDKSLGKIGLSFVSSDDPDFKAKAQKIKGIRSVIHDFSAQWYDPQSERAVSAENLTDTHEIGPVADNDFFFPLQWGMLAIDARDAWAKGFKGQGVSVAILDTGFDLDHPDLSPNIDNANSVSLVPGEGLQYNLPNTFSHGTHVAGIVAAADNAYGTIGVAPQAKLILVKVLRDSGSGDFSWIMQGIVHATDHGADVINMSIGAFIPHHSQTKTPDGVVNETNEIQELLVAMNRVTNYAYKNGVTVVTSAGNESVDLNHIADYDHYPSGCNNVISIAATSPVGWAKNFATDLDIPTTYTNFGTSGVDFAGPGGDLYDSVTGNCTVGPISGVPCGVYDLVFSTGNNGWYWAGGTSMASPHAAGVAALIVGKYGGNISPNQVKSILQKSSEDKGKPGKDAYFGFGRINASNAVDY